VPGRRSHVGAIPADGIDPRLRDHLLAAIGQDHHSTAPCLRSRPSTFRGLPSSGSRVTLTSMAASPPLATEGGCVQVARISARLHVALQDRVRAQSPSSQALSADLLARDLSERGLSVRELPPAAI
jgi:hypothetical protein